MCTFVTRTAASHTGDDRETTFTRVQKVRTPCEINVCMGTSFHFSFHSYTHISVPLNKAKKG